MRIFFCPSASEITGTLRSVKIILCQYLTMLPRKYLSAVHRPVFSLCCLINQCVTICVSEVMVLLGDPFFKREMHPEGLLTSRSGECIFVNICTSCRTRFFLQMCAFYQIVFVFNTVLEGFKQLLFRYKYGNKSG